MHLPVSPAATNSLLVGAVDILYAPFATLYHTRDSHAEEAGAILAEWLSAVLRGHFAYYWPPSNMRSMVGFAYEVRCL